MIASGLMRAVARRPLWPLAIAGVAAAPVFPGRPCPGGPMTGARVVTHCGNGVSAVTVRLPAGFSPLTATAAQLVANDLPLRPVGRVELAAWRRFVTGGVRSVRTTCGFAAVTPPAHPGRSWATLHPASSQSIVGDAQPAGSQSIVG